MRVFWKHSPEHNSRSKREAKESTEIPKRFPREAVPRRPTPPTKHINQLSHHHEPLSTTAAPTSPNSSFTMSSQLSTCACRNFATGKFSAYANSCGIIQMAKVPAASEIWVSCPMNFRTCPAKMYIGHRTKAMLRSNTHDRCMYTPSMSSFPAPTACPHSVSNALPIPKSTTKPVYRTSNDEDHL